MDRLAKISTDALIQRMRAEFEKTMTEVVAAVNDARDGHLIDGSEERCRDALGEFRRRAYETAVQMRVEATEADPSFSPCGSRTGSSRPSAAHGAELLREGGSSSPPLRKSRRGNGRTGG